MVGKFEIRKDTAQVVVESAATHVGRIATILSGAVRQVTHELGDWASDVFEIREAADRARRADQARAFDAADTVKDELGGATESGAVGS